MKKAFIVLSVLTAFLFGGCVYRMKILNETDPVKVRSMAKDKNIRDQVDGGASALMATIALDRTQSAIILVDEGADVNKQDKEGQTALMYAIAKKNNAVMDAIIAKAPNFELKNKQGMTALWYAIENDDEGLVTKFLKAGANPNAEDKDGDVPLSFVSQKGNINIARILLSYKADIKAKSKKDGYTPIMFAAQNADRKFIELLLKEGAEINAVDNKGMNSLYRAIGANKTDNFNCLIENKIAINLASTDGQGITPLMAAVYVKNKDMVESLIKKGADLNVKGPKGFTALDIAKMSGQNDMAQMIKDNMK
jgi:ankyrin repeat protein